MKTYVYLTLGTGLSGMAAAKMYRNHKKIRRMEKESTNKHMKMRIMDAVFQAKTHNYHKELNKKQGELTLVDSQLKIMDQKMQDLFARLQAQKRELNKHDRHKQNILLNSQKKQQKIENLNLELKQTVINKKRLVDHLSMFAPSLSRFGKSTNDSDVTYRT